MDMFRAAIGNPVREELASVLSNPYDRHPHQSLPGWAPDRDWVPAGSSNTRQGDILQVARERNNSNTIDLYYIFLKKNNLKFLKKTTPQEGDSLGYPDRDADRDGAEAVGETCGDSAWENAGLEAGREGTARGVRP